MFSSRFGGPVTMVADAAESLASLGVEVTIFASDLGKAPWAGDWRSIEPDELPPNADKLNYELFPVRWPQRLMYSPELAERLDEVVEDFDLVHIHSLWLHPQYAGQRAARRHDRPYIVSPHGALDPYLRQRGRARKAGTSLAWQNRMLKHAELIHVTTEDEQKLIADIAPAVPRAIVPNGLWIDRLSPADADGERFRRRHMDGFEGPLVMFLGRLNFKKGVDVLIDAFAIATHKNRDAKLAIVGPDDEGLLAQLEAQVERLGVDERVIFTGALYGEDRTDALAAADIWALSSHSENFGIAVVEAMAAGAATVISPAVNLAPDVLAADAGLVAEQRPEPFAAALIELLTDEARRAQVAENGRVWVQRYDWSVVGPELLQMYERAASSKKSGGTP
jgi:glycosyltransferase involved in cell wall biosynthesis